jgi:hypothetical protein
MPKASLQAVEEIRAAAVRMLDEAFDILREERVIPCPVAHPYVRVGRDFYGGDVMGAPHFVEFSQTLERIFPEWFVAERPAFPRWYANHFALRLIEDAIAQIGREDGEYAGSNEACEASILKLVAYLEANNTEVICVRLIGHLLPPDGELVLGEVTVRSYDRFHDVRDIARELPGSPIAFNRTRPDHFARPEAWVIARASGPDPFELPQPAQRPIERLLLAVRLLYAATSHGIYQVIGENSEICRYHTEVQILDHEPHPLTVRPAVLDGDSARRIAGLLDLYDRAPLRQRNEIVHPMEMAILKFSGSFLPGGWFEHIVDLMTAMEATLSGISKTDISLRVCMRASLLLCVDADPPSAIFADLSKLYDLRSRLVHGGTITQRDLDRWINDLSVSREGAAPAIRTAIAIDRLRDLVRRSILARLALAEEGSWPLRGNPPAVDQLLADPETARTWRERWHAGLAALGAEEASNPPLRLADAIMDDYPGK